MIRNLAADQETAGAKSAKKLIEAAEPAGDDVGSISEPGESRCTRKNAWMLRSHLE